LHALIRPGNGEVRPDFPKEAEIAAENTFIKVLETFDSILEDRSRWNLDTQRHLAKRFEDAHTLNLKYLDEQAKFAEELNTPHFRFKPSLMRLKDGRFLAIIGNVDDLDNALIGVGETAAEALSQFDQIFNRGLPAVLAEHLAKREAALEAGHAPESFPIIQKQNTDTKHEEQKPVVARRNKQTPKAPKRRKNQSGNS